MESEEKLEKTKQQQWGQENKVANEQIKDIQGRAEINMDKMRNWGGGEIKKRIRGLEGGGR